MNFWTKTALGAALVTTLAISVQAGRKTETFDSPVLQNNFSAKLRLKKKTFRAHGINIEAYSPCVAISCGELKSTIDCELRLFIFFTMKAFEANLKGSLSKDIIGGIVLKEKTAISSKFNHKYSLPMFYEGTDDCVWKISYVGYALMLNDGDGKLLYSKISTSKLKDIVPLLNSRTSDFFAFENGKDATDKSCPCVGTLGECFSEGQKSLGELYSMNTKRQNHDTR